MDLEKLQSALREIIAKIEALMAQEGKEDEVGALMEESKSIRRRIDQAMQVKALRDYSRESTGSVVSQGFTREALPGEGEIMGISAKGADLYAIDGSGQAKLEALKSGAYKDALNQYIRRSWKGQPLDGNAMKVLNEGIDTSGGYWITPDYRSEVIKKMATMTAIRPNASVFTASSNTLSFPKVTYTTDDLYTSGVRFGWTEENPASDISEATNPVAGRVNISVNLATCAVYLTRSMMEDSGFDVMGYVSELIGEAYALGEEDAFINGNGSGKPQGILTHPDVATLSTSGGMQVKSGDASYLKWGTSTTTASNVTTGIIGMEAALPPQYEAGAKWVAHKGTYASLQALVDSTGRPLWNTVDQYPMFNTGRAANLLGYETAKSNFMPTIAANAYPLLFGDLRSYFIVDRVGLSIEVLREVQALKDIVVVYARKRLGGQLVHPWKMKVQKVAA